MSKYFVFLAFLTFFTILIFIIQTSYSKLISPVKKIEDDTILKPIDPNLDDDILDQIQQRQKFSQLDLDSIKNLTPTATSSPDSSATSSGTSSL